MTESMDCSSAQYAVIEARWTEGRSERFVIAYSDEATLRDLFAGPSIIASSFVSRELARANLDANPSTIPQNDAQTKAVPEAAGGRHSMLSSGWPFLAGLRQAETWRMLRGCFRAAAAAAVLTFYSKNTVIAAIRSFVAS